MKTLQAQDALCSTMIKVRGDEQVSHYRRRASRAVSAFAVFDSENTSDTAERFLGLVSTEGVKRNPTSTFMDLVGDTDGQKVKADRPLEEVIGFMKATEYDVIPIFNAEEEFIGIISKMSALEAILGQHAQLQVSYERLERRMRTIRRRSRILYEEIPYMCFGFSPDGTVLTVNRFGAEQLGYKVSELTGQSMEMVIPKADRQTFYEQVKQCLRTSATLTSWEGQKIRKNGSVIRVKESARVITGAQNRRVVVMVGEEVSNANHVARVNSLEYHYHQILNSIDDLVFVKNKESQLLWANKAFQDYYGMSREQLTGIIDSPVNTSTFTQQYLRDDQLVISTGKVLRVPKEPIRRVDGEVRYFNTVKTPIFDEAKQVAMLVGVCRDITDKLRDEENLKLAQFAMDRSADAIVWLDSQGRVLYVNDAGCRTLGYHRDEFLSLSVQDMTPAFSPGRWRRFWEKLKRVGAVTIEANQKTKHGHTFPVEIKANFLAVEGKECHCWIVRDVSERKNYESRLLSQNRLLRLDAEIGGILSRNDPFSVQLQKCMDALVKELGVILARIWTCAPSDSTLFLRASSGLDTHIGGSHSRIPFGRQAVGTIAALKAPHLTNNVLGDSSILDQEWAKRKKLVSFAGYPLVKHGQVLGVLGVFGREKLTRSTMKALETVSDYLTLAIEQQRAAEEKHSLALQNQLLLDSAGEGIYGLNHEGRITFVNPSAAAILGYSKEELLGISMHEKMHHSLPDGSSYSKETCPIYMALKDGLVHCVDDEVFWKKDGTSFPVQYTSTPMVKTGEIIGVVVTFQDITERRKAEEALKNSEEGFRTLAEAIPQQVWTAQPDGALDYVNQRVLDYFRRTSDQIIGWNWKSVIHPDDLPLCLEKWNRALQTGEGYEMEFRLLRAPDQSYRWHLARAVPVRDDQGAIVKWFGTSTDITERKEAEQELEKMALALEDRVTQRTKELLESERRNQALITSIPDLIITYDEHGNYLRVKPGRTFSASLLPEECIGKNVRDVLPAEIAESILLHIDAALRTNELITVEYETNREGHVRTFEARYVQCGDHEVLNLIREITEQKVMVQQIRKQTETLEKMVEERTQTIRVLEVQRLQAEKLAALGQIAAGVAHEINNPLAGIKTSFTLLKKAIPRNNPDYEFVFMMEDAIERVSTIVSDMYLLYGARTQKWKMVELRELMKTVQRFLQSKKEQRMQTITFMLPDSNPSLFLPEQDLLQILTNLVQNAIDVSPEGEVILVQARVNMAMLEIRVLDHGQGIPHDLLPRIFEPFFSTKSNAKGTRMGLGLSVSRSLAETIGGRLEVESTSHQGTIFTLSIPLDSAPQGEGEQGEENYTHENPD